MNFDMDFDVSNVDEIDMDAISDSADLVNRRDQDRAEQLISDFPPKILTSLRRYH
jgi:hypothetical protein